MDKVDNKNRTALSLIWILTLVVVLVGATFGYFTAISKTEEQIIKTQNLSIGVAIQGSTNVTNIKPTTWSNTLSENETNVDIAKIPFNVTSNSKLNGTYKVTLGSNIIENALLSGGNVSDIKYRLYKSGAEIKSGSFTAGSFSEDIASGITSKDVDLNDEYKLYIYIDETNTEQNKLQNITFAVTLTGSANQTE